MIIQYFVRLITKRKNKKQNKTKKIKNWIENKECNVNRNKEKSHERSRDIQQTIYNSYKKSCPLFRIKLSENGKVEFILIHHHNDSAAGRNQNWINLANFFFVFMILPFEIYCDII